MTAYPDPKEAAKRAATRIQAKSKPGVVYREKSLLRAAGVREPDFKDARAADDEGEKTLIRLTNEWAMWKRDFRAALRDFCLARDGRWLKTKAGVGFAYMAQLDSQVEAAHYAQRAAMRKLQQGVQRLKTAVPALKGQAERATNSAAQAHLTRLELVLADSPLKVQAVRVEVDLDTGEVLHGNA